MKIGDWAQVTIIYCYGEPKNCVMFRITVPAKVFSKVVIFFARNRMSALYLVAGYTVSNEAPSVFVIPIQ